ncbi:MAG: hypothetical protein K6E30_02400 [Lachnospiraceae bacterium]|nr:hypothetical protein [Lachnospiraceae bacterium]
MDRERSAIHVSYHHRIVRIRTDEVLLGALSRNSAGVYAAAEHILKTYEAHMGETLKISRDSLAAEILLHAYLDAFFRRLEGTVCRKAGAGKLLNRPIARLIRSTEVIDCGEREVDGNRIVFDVLAPFGGFICRVLGKKAWAFALGEKRLQTEEMKKGE